MIYCRICIAREERADQVHAWVLIYKNMFEVHQITSIHDHSNMEIFQWSCFLLSTEPGYMIFINIKFRLLKVLQKDLFQATDTVICS